MNVEHANFLARNINCILLNSICITQHRHVYKAKNREKIRQLSCPIPKQNTKSHKYLRVMNCIFEREKKQTQLRLTTPNRGSRKMIGNTSKSGQSTSSRRNSYNQPKSQRQKLTRKRNQQNALP